MKKFLSFVMIALAASAVYSCQKEAALEPETIEGTGNIRTFTCTIADLESKVSVDATGKTAWEDGDEIVIHGHKVNQNVVVALHDFSNENQVASFSVDLEGVRGVSDNPGEYYVSYPASAYIGLSGSDEGYNGYYSGFSDTNHPLLAGYLDGDTFVFHNLCGVLTFKVEGDYDSYLFEGNRAETVSYDAYRVKITKSEQDYKSWKTDGEKASVTGTVNGDGATLNHVYFPNGASFPHGFTIYFMKEGVIKGYVTSDKSIGIERGHQKNMGLLPAGKIHERLMGSWATNAIDLNNVGGAKQDPANCYQLVRSSSYRDKVFKFWAVKGNDLSQPVEGIASLEVLWESRCQGSSNTPGIIVKNIDFDKNHIYFQTPAGDDFKDGNAVIAAKDSEGKILWSWHIWVSNDEVQVISSAAVAAKAVMDRNLGALRAATTETTSHVTSYGLLYQWGRKDPFLGAKYNESGSLPGYTSAGSRTFTALSEKITLDYSIANPMTLGCASDGSDWCTAETTDANFWSESTKTIYDPCPSGYRVMKRDYSHTEIWSDTYKTDLTGVTGWSINAANYAFTFGDPAVVFPLAGYKDGSTSTTSAGKRAGVWCSKSSDESAYFLNIRADKSTYNRISTARGRSYSVRCIAE